MNKQTKIILGAVLVLVIVIVAISFLYPTVFKGLTSGTIGKADKYHQTQMTEKDIMLRSELVSDSNQLRNMIQGLIYFSLFTEELSSKIDSCVDQYRTQGICTDPDKCATISVLEDFSGYIKNNNKTLRSTISMLTAFYLKDDSDQAADVEKNLRDFGVYVSNLNEKDSILNLALHTMDNYLLSSRMLKTKKMELASLKSIRDQLLIQGVQLSGMLQDKPLCGQLLSYALSSQQSYNIIVFNQEKLSAALMPAAQEKLNAIGNSEKIEGFVVGNQVSFGKSEQLSQVLQGQQMSNMVQSKGGDLGNLYGSVMVYDKENLQFVVGNKQELSRVLSSAALGNILSGSQLAGGGIIVGSFSQIGVSIAAANFSLQNALQSQALSALYGTGQLGALMNLEGGIGSVAYCANFIGVMQQLGGMGLSGHTVPEP